MLEQALGESERCRLLLENTAGAGNTLGRSFEELRELIDLAGGHKRIGVCLDSCHMLASGFDITTAKKLSAVIDSHDQIVGKRRLRCLHVNDSQGPVGLQPRPPCHPRRGRDRLRGCGAFPSEPRFEKLPALFEGPGTSGRAGQGGRGPDEGAAPQRLRARRRRRQLSAAGAAGSPGCG